MGSRERENAVQRMKDYVEEHITEPITLRMLADAANYSPWHAERIFKELTGQTPFEYLRAVRLSRAAARLRDTDAKIIDVAFDFVFGSHDGFTRAFSRQFGMTPQRFRKHTPPIRSLTPDQVRGYHLTLQKGANIMPEDWSTFAQVQVIHRPVFVQVIDRPARNLILKRGVKATHYGEYCDEVGGEEVWEVEVWEVLCSIKEAIYEPIGMWMPENLRKPGTSFYTQGVEVPADYAGEIPDGFELIDLSPCKMMVFQGPPYDEGEPQMSQAIGLIQDAMDTYDPNAYGFEWADEDGPRFQLAPAGYRGYIEGRPVRQLNVKSQKARRGKPLQAGLGRRQG
jgi:AraC family transcriptional regulator